MKGIQVGLSALMLLFSSAFTQAQQRTATAGSNPNSGDGSVIENITGSGKKDYVALWLTGSSLGDSKIFQTSGAEIGIGTTTPAANTGAGMDTHQSNTTGYENTASGYGALRLNTSGS